MSSSAGVEDSLAYLLMVTSRDGLHGSRESFTVKVEPEPVAQHVVGQSRDRVWSTGKSLARKGSPRPVEFL